MQRTNTLGAGKQRHSSAARRQHNRQTPPRCHAVHSSNSAASTPHSLTLVFDCVCCAQTALLSASSSLPPASLPTSSSVPGVAVSEWRQLSSLRLLLSLLADARLARRQWPTPACVAVVLVALARVADTLTLAAQRLLLEEQSGAGSSRSEAASLWVAPQQRTWEWMEACWAAMLRLCACLAQQQQVSLTHTSSTPVLPYPMEWSEYNHYEHAHARLRLPPPVLCSVCVLVCVCSATR